MKHTKSLVEDRRQTIVSLRISPRLTPENEEVLVDRLLSSNVSDAIFKYLLKVTRVQNRIDSEGDGKKMLCQC